VNNVPCFYPSAASNVGNNPLSLYFPKEFDHINWFVILKVWLIPSLLDGVEKYQYEFL